MKKKRRTDRHQTRKLPAQPLITMFRDDLTHNQIAHILHRDRNTLRRWIERGIPQYEADKVACLIGVHPSHIWGEEWWQSISIP